MDQIPPPRFTGTVRFIDITGMLCPFSDALRPCIFRTLGSNQPYIAVFSTEENLHHICGLLGYGGYRIKRIDDGPVFMKEVFQHPLHIMVDPHIKETGKVGWTEMNKESEFLDNLPQGKHYGQEDGTKGN